MTPKPNSRSSSPSSSVFAKVLLPLIALIFFAGAMMSHSVLDAENSNPLVATGLWVAGIASLCGWLFAIRRELSALFGEGDGSSAKARKPALNTLLMLLILCAVGYLSSRSRFNGTVDITRNQSNTLSAQTVKVIDSYVTADKTVQVTGYFQNEIMQERFKALLGLYQNAGLSIDSRYYDPEAEPAKAIAAQITNANTVVVSLGDKDNRMTSFTEERLTNSLIAVLKEKTAKIYFSQGHGEGQLNGQNADDFDLIASELKGNKYELASFSMTSGIPADADLIIIAGIKYDLKAAEIAPLRAYLREGKPLLALVDALVPVSRLNALLSEFGVTFADDFLMLRSDDQRAQLLGTQNAIVSQFDTEHPVTKDFAQKNQMALLMPYSRSITTGASRIAEISAKAIAKTADGVVAITEAKSQRSLKNISPNRIATGPFDVIAVASGSIPVSTPPAAVNTQKGQDKEQKAQEKKPQDRKKSEGKGKDKGQEEQKKAAQKLHKKSFRLIVAGSSRFATNQGAQRAEHRDMLVNMVNYLVQDDDFIAIRPRSTMTSALRIVDRSSVMILAFLCFGYPFIVLGMGAWHSYRRRRTS